MDDDEGAAQFFANFNAENDKIVDDQAADFFAELNDGPSDIARSPQRNPVTSPREPSLSSTVHLQTMQSNQFDNHQRYPSTIQPTKLESHVYNIHPIGNGLPVVKKEKMDYASLKAESKEPSLPMEERVVNMLIPEMKVSEIMVLIKKMRHAGKSESDEFSEQTLDQKTAPRFICEVCGNTDQNNFITDYARGDTICKGKDGGGCGTVVQDHIVHEGSAYRKFEGEEDKSHHGPAPNKLFSSGHNLRTLISVDGQLASVLRRASDFVEMNLSQMGKDERRTRIGYKDQMKRKACSMIDHVASNLDLHELVVGRAKEMFAEFRDLREHVHQFEAVVAGCIIAAYIEIGKLIFDAQSGKKVAATTLNSFSRPDFAIEESFPKPVDEVKLHPFSCEWCDMKFNAKRGMQFHKCSKKPSEESESKGTSLELSPIDISENVNPIIEIKGGRKWYTCPSCSKSFERENSLGDHMKRHTNQMHKREEHIRTADIDTTRLLKKRKLASANPSVQVNTHENVLFRGGVRRSWLNTITKEDDQSFR